MRINLHNEFEICCPWCDAPHEMFDLPAQTSIWGTDIVSRPSEGIHSTKCDECGKPFRVETELAIHPYREQEAK